MRNEYESYASRSTQFVSRQPERHAVAPGVGAAGDQAGRRVDGDALAAADQLVPGADHLDGVAAPRERLGDLAVDPALDHHPAAGGLGDPHARRLDRRLDAEAEV